MTMQELTVLTKIAAGTKATNTACALLIEMVAAGDGGMHGRKLTAPECRAMSYLRKLGCVRTNRFAQCEATELGLVIAAALTTEMR